ncbi:MAG: phosphohydrolase, partial [Candidatus Electrothrix sp. AR4]|nr:phosphohydrolase [Candidatus Electrothrix sp. AR4]
KLLQIRLHGHMTKKIIFDADKLDSIGAIGIGRAFLFAGQIGARLHNAEIDPAQTDSYSTEDTAYREFQVKMSKVRDQMLTPVGQGLALRRHEFMETFFVELHREIYGSELP